MDPSAPHPELPSEHPLAGCEQKLRRAHTHFKQLKAEIADLVPNGFRPATFRTDAKPNAKDTLWTFVETVTPLPLALSTIIGDIVHNQRSTLDLLVFELGFLGMRGKTIPRRTAFPISTDRANWRSDYVQNTFLQGVLREHRTMLYRLQPCYRRKDNPSAATLRRRKPSLAVHLHNLWNEDKHRMIQLVAMTPHEISPVIRYRGCDPLGHPMLGTGFLGHALKAGTEVLTIPIQPTTVDPQVSVDVEVAFQVCLGNGMPVLVTLAHVGDWVTQVVEYFQPVFETPRARRLWGLPRGSWVERQPPPRRRKPDIERWGTSAPHPTTRPTG